MRRKRGTRADQQPTVLLVEPRAEDLEQTRLVLVAAGFRVVPLTRFDAVVPLFQVVRPDAVLLAAQAPDFAALGAVRRLRQLSRGTVPLLYLVDAGDEAAHRLCVEKGQGVDVVSRAVSGAELALKLHAALRLREAVQRAAREEEGTPLALHDPLTGLYNRGFLQALIGLEMRRTERYGGSFSVVGCAVQGYQSFRKEYRRALAERLLVFSGVVLGQAVREADVVARVGEEEFALLLPGMPAEALDVVLPRIASRFELARFQVEGRVVRLAVALGAVSFPDTVGAPSQLLSGAMQEMRRMRDARRVVGGPVQGPTRMSV
ncbi:diguanylate cyclase [Myxococcaceae bacterium GXIMD 01537]